MSKQNNTRKQRIAAKRIPEFAFTIKDKYFPDFKVRSTDSGWWKDQLKVDKLITAFKMDCSIMEACTYTGISYNQYEQFNLLHKDFSVIKQLCSELPALSARNEVVKGLSGDKEFSLKYLQNKRAKEFNTRTVVENEIGENTMKQFTNIVDALKEVNRRKELTDSNK